MSDTKSNPYTLIAGFLLPWKVAKNSTRKEQPNNNKKPCAWILLVLQCLQNPTQFITLPGKILAKSHKFKKSKTFRLFEFFDFFDFSTFRMFRFFRLFEQKSPGMWTFRLFDFSRSKNVIFSCPGTIHRNDHKSPGHLGRRFLPRGEKEWGKRNRSLVPKIWAGRGQKKHR